MKNNEYWAQREAKSQEILTTKTIKETNKEIKKYYLKCYKNLLGQYQETYNALFSQKDRGKPITPAHLYNLDRYWSLQGQVKTELLKLGASQIAKLETKFNGLYIGVWLSVDLPESNKSWAVLDKEAITKVINSIWCADGKSWSQRVWDNTDKLQQALNDNLISCVVNGSNPEDLRKLLMKQFSVSYERANMLVNTEMAHIQTEAAKDRYKAAGCREVEVYGEEDSSRCDICAKLHGQRFPINGRMPVPAHPNCRCCIIPVVEDETELTYQEKNDKIETIKHQKAGQTLPIGFQFFAKKSTDYKTIHLPQKEYSHVMSEIATWATEQQLNQKVFNKCIGKYVYTVENNEFGNFRIINRRKIK